MAITAAFTISQSALAPNLITVNDTAVGTYGTITKRRIFFQTNDGTYLKETGVTTDYNDWALADLSETFDVLTQDQALVVTVQWLTAADVVVNTLTQVYALTEYNKQFFYYLIQQLAITPSILQDSNYATNMATYWMYITAAIQAIEIGADVAASQACLDKATFMKENQTKFF